MTDERQLPALQASALLPVPLEEIKQLAQICSESGYFEGANKPAQAMVKILKGHELGMSPMEAMESIYVANGKTGLHAANVAARIQSSQTYRYEIIESTEEICRLKFFKNGQELPGEAKFSYQDAVDAGYVQRNAKQYQANRENMLFNRAVMRGYRKYCPEIFRLPVYSREELDDFIDAEKVSVVSAKEAQKDQAAQLIANAGKKRGGKAVIQQALDEAAWRKLDEPPFNAKEFEFEAPVVISETTPEPEEASGEQVVEPAAAAPANDAALISAEDWARLLVKAQAQGWNSLDLQRLSAKTFNMPVEDAEIITMQQAKRLSAIVSRLTPEKAGVRNE